MLADHAYRLGVARRGAQQLVEAHTQRIGQPPCHGNGRIGLVALDLRQHRFGDAGRA